MKNYDNRGRNISRRIAAAAIALCVMLFAFSCYDDKGTDPKDWNALNEIRIDTAGLGIRPVYAVKQGEDIIEIAPKIYYKGDLVSDNTKELEFSWVLYGSSSNRIDTLSTATNVSAVMTRASGTYTLLFCVAELNTRIQNYCSFSVEITTEIPDGYLVLYETADGDTDVGIVSNDWINPAMVNEKVLYDIFSGGNEGAVLKGKPVSIKHSFRTYSPTAAANASKEVLIASESDYVAVNRDEFFVAYQMAELFSSGIPVENITAMGFMGNAGFGVTNSASEWIIADNQVYYTAASSSNANRANATKLSDAMYGNYGELAPWLPYFRNYQSFALVVYDQTNTCFRHVPASGIEIKAFAKESVAAAFDITNTGMRMIASDWGYGMAGQIPAQGTYYEYSLMKGASGNALLITDWNTASSTARAKAKFDLTGYPDIDEATMVAAGTSGPVYYYATSKGIYLTNPNISTGQVNGANKVWTAPDGEEITVLKVHKESYNLLSVATGAFINNNQVLYVATWNEDSGEGSVYQIPMDPSNGSLTPDSARRYTGFGKIKDLCWKWKN